MSPENKAELAEALRIFTGAEIYVLMQSNRRQAAKADAVDTQRDLAEAYALMVAEWRRRQSGRSI